MRRLTLLLILSPILVFGQNRQRAIADSIRAAGKNLQAVSGFISRMPGTDVEHIQVSDSDEYLTMVVHIHIAGATVIPRLPVIGTRKIQIPERIFTAPGVAPQLARYRPLLEKDTITPLAVSDVRQLKLLQPGPSRLWTVVVPTFPFEPEEPEPLMTLDARPLEINAPQRAHPVAVAVPVFEEKKMEVSEMHLSDEGYALLEKMEGFSPELYSLKDGGFTIGFGFFVPYGEAGKWSKGVTVAEAERILREKVPSYEDQVKQYINVPLTQTEFDALTMLAYNLGGFAKATSIVNDINSGGDFGMLQRDWMRFVHSKAPNVMKGLVNRRKDELRVRNEMYYQPERKLLIYNNKR